MTIQQGWSQMTPAVRSILNSAGKLGSRVLGAPKKRRKKKTAKKAAARSASGKRKTKRPAKMKKGSAAAKKYMASLRAMRK